MMVEQKRSLWLMRRGKEDIKKVGKKRGRGGKALLHSFRKKGGKVNKFKDDRLKKSTLLALRKVGKCLERIIEVNSSGKFLQGIKMHQ